MRAGGRESAWSAARLQRVCGASAAGLRRVCGASAARLRRVCGASAERHSRGHGAGIAPEAGRIFVDLYSTNVVLELLCLRAGKTGDHAGCEMAFARQVLHTINYRHYRIISLFDSSAKFTYGTDFNVGISGFHSGTLVVRIVFGSWLDLV